MKLEDGWAGFIKTMINEIKRIFCNPLIYASIVVGLIVINRPLIEVLWSGVVESGSISQFLSIPLATSDFTPFAAVFCALPFAASFCDDYNSGNYLYIISRSGTKKYVAIKKPFGCPIWRGDHGRNYAWNNNLLWSSCRFP